jgi:tetratricopeptide (TPR) repeat protein
MHNYGAIQCLERLLGLVHPNGFILMNEYGMTTMNREDEYEHQRFSLATAVGLNFPLLKAYFHDNRKLVWVEPFSGEGRGIETRLLGHQPANETVVKFHERFHPDAFKRLNEPIEHARACVKAGRFEMAADFYQKALDKQPHNWYLMGEISSFLTFQMRDAKAGIDMAKLALAENPACSAELWNILGDALYEFGRTGEAKSAYQKALAVNNSDVRARHNLAWVHTREKDFKSALQMIAEALAYDKTGQLRDRLLQKQQEILALQAIQHQQEYLLYVNFVSRDAKKQGDDKPDEPQPITVIPPKPN